jgi:hypothetical protein
MLPAKIGDAIVFLEPGTTNTVQRLAGGAAEAPSWSVIEALDHRVGTRIARWWQDRGRDEQRRHHPAFVSQWAKIDGPVA